MCQGVILLMNGTARLKCSYLPSNHNYILLPTQFSFGTCHLLSLPAETPSFLSFDLQVGTYYHIRAELWKACLGSLMCLGCIWQSVSHFRPSSPLSNAVPLASDLPLAPVSFLLCFSPWCFCPIWSKPLLVFSFFSKILISSFVHWVLKY